MGEERRGEEIRELREELAQLRLAVANLVAILQEKGILSFADMLDLGRRIANDQEQVDGEPGKPPAMPWWSPGDRTD